MTCRCRSPEEHASRAVDTANANARADAQEKQKRIDQLMARSPDPDRFEIEEIEQVMDHLVLKVKYPSCATCAYDGLKVMVFEKRTIKDAIKWRRIDPHFQDPQKTKFDPKHAPSPAARFPGSAEGWQRAISWARFIQEPRTRSSNP